MTFKVGDIVRKRLYPLSKRLVLSERDTQGFFSIQITSNHPAYDEFYPIGHVFKKAVSSSYELDTPAKPKETEYNESEWE